mgnify:FL=1
MRACQKVLGEADSNCTTVADLLAQWQDTAIAPAAQYAVIHQLDNAVDAMYTAAKQKPPTMRWIRSTAWMPAM